MSSSVDVSVDRDGLYCLTWPQRGRQTGKTYVIGVRQLQDPSAATANGSAHEWMAVLTSPSSNTIKLDTSDLSDGGSLLGVEVLECSSMHKQGRLVERSFNVANIGSAEIEVDSGDHFDVSSSMSRLHISSGNSIHRNSGSAGSLRHAIPVMPLHAKQGNYHNRHRHPRSVHTTLHVFIERQRFDEAKVRWDSNILPAKWQVVVEEVSDATLRSPKEVYFVDGGAARELDLSKPLTARTRYRVTVRALQYSQHLQHGSANGLQNYDIVGQQSTEFLAVLSRNELDELHDRAMDAVDPNDTAQCFVLYRNKSRSYFDKVMRRHRGVMKTYVKDHSGDKLSPINGQINGLFFMAEVEPGTSEPCYSSAFGNTRLLVPVEDLMEMAPKLYFADYYCMRGVNHYVTLVMTTPDSEADVFCSQYLLSLSISGRNHNSFLYRNKKGNFRVANGVKVEILFTEDVDIKFLTKYRGAGMQYNIPLIGKGHSTPGGVPKRDDCQECNLYPRLTPARGASRHRAVSAASAEYYDDDWEGFDYLADCDYECSGHLSDACDSFELYDCYDDDDY